MDEQEITQLSDEDILSKLKSAELANRLEHDEHFRIIREACKRMHVRAIAQLVTVNPTDNKKIIQLQLMAQFYENILLTMITNFKKEAEAVFPEAVASGLIPEPPSNSGSTPR